MRVTPSNSSLSCARRALRTQLRSRRRGVSPLHRDRAARLVAHNVDRAFRLRPGLRLAVYASMPEELDTAPLIALARRRGCRIFLPRINRRTGRIRFVESVVGGRERRNHLGIVEPHGTPSISARWLDLVLAPLVGFDHRGMRLGMGGGFYDRTFAFRNIHRAWRRPRLIGVAYALQQLPSIEPAPHDVRLDAVITEKGVVRCRTGS
jgi:5-formyltetrahydrofolate cyclo-ligase